MEPDELLIKWEESYKKGLLSFWILLLLHERPSYPFEMRPLIEEISQKTISADDNSLYRALNRFQELGIVDSQTQPSSQGPARRYYHLTPTGLRLLTRFVERNIQVFALPQVADRIRALLAQPLAEESK
jgi:DNA-binding PadR family transcriptional regulator